MITEKKTYIIPFRKAWFKVPKYRRAVKSIRAIKEFIKKHTKETDIRIGKYLNLEVWSRGRKNPPHKVHVNAIPVEITDKKKKVTRHIKVELVGAPEEKIEEKKEEKKETLEKVVEKEEKKETKEKEETPKEEKKKEIKKPKKEEEKPKEKKTIAKKK